MVATARGFTAPVSVAPVGAIAVASGSATMGGVSAAVVNWSSALRVVPSSLVATSRK